MLNQSNRRVLPGAITGDTLASAIFLFFYF